MAPGLCFMLKNPYSPKESSLNKPWFEWLSSPWYIVWNFPTLQHCPLLGGWRTVVGGDGHIFGFDFGLFESLSIYSKKIKQIREIHIVGNIDLGKE